MVTGILFSDEPSAVVDGQVVKEGDILYGRIKVNRILLDQVEFERDGYHWFQRVGWKPDQAWTAEKITPGEPNGP